MISTSLYSLRKKIGSCMYIKVYLFLTRRDQEKSSIGPKCSFRLLFLSSCSQMKECLCERKEKQTWCDPGQTGYAITWWIARCSGLTLACLRPGRRALSTACTPINKARARARRTCMRPIRRWPNDLPGKCARDQPGLRTARK